MHKHHIIPKHAGGTDDPSNLIELTVEEHAEAHRLLFEQYGRWQDYVAWQGLLKLTPKEELIRQIQSNTQRRLLQEGTHIFLGENHPSRIRVKNGTHPFFDKQKAKERAIKRVKEGKCNLSNKPIITCPHCGKSGDQGNMSRWHFNKCKKYGYKSLE